MRDSSLYEVRSSRRFLNWRQKIYPWVCIYIYIYILNLQEIYCNEESFNNCDMISSTFSFYKNNSPTKYGTASLKKSDLKVTNLQYDSNGHVIVFDVIGLTIANLYLPSSTDRIAPSGQEEYMSTVLPELLLNCQDIGCAGGNFNYIID